MGAHGLGRGTVCCNICKRRIQPRDFLPTTKGEFSPIESEMISLDRAVTSCDHWLRFAPEINLIFDCTGLLDLLDKNLCKIRNHRLQNILERVQPYN